MRYSPNVSEKILAQAAVRHPNELKFTKIHRPLPQKPNFTPAKCATDSQPPQT
ncbi:hypothetical protein CSUNSWCD_1416 [Campylobacter showae CSUNSWCD]|uniref:Uncharacterized protein n=1 Tax=Campylobacter showae CSUNSWCD TaxID=1244083 RepID=M5ID22_9BACT|nr:hypothetical protein CSUNSWCD_1416 [Campylobacter showae CSUNSWCD]